MTRQAPEERLERIYGLDTPREAGVVQCLENFSGDVARAIGVWIGFSVGTFVYAGLLILRFRMLTRRLAG